MLPMLLAFFEEERVNITPVLLRFTGKFFLLFGAVAVVAILTPWLAKKVDAFREKHGGTPAPHDPRCDIVRGPYDMPAPVKKPEEETPADSQPDDETES